MLDYVSTPYSIICARSDSSSGATRRSFFHKTYMPTIRSVCESDGFHNYSRANAVAAINSCLSKNNTEIYRAEIIPLVKVAIKKAINFLSVRCHD